MYNEIIRLKWKIYLIKKIENKLHHIDVDRADAFALLNCARYVESYGGLERGKETKQTEAAIASNDTRYEFRTFTYINSTILIFLYTCNLFYVAPRFIINLWLFLLRNNKIRVASLYI